MDNEDIAERKLEELTGADDLSTAIKKLEKQREFLENDFKDQAHVFFENLNPVTLLDKTLQNVKKSSFSRYALFREALAFGTGILSKRKLLHEFKSALIKTFTNYSGDSSYIAKEVTRNQNDTNSGVTTTIFKKKVMI